MLQIEITWLVEDERAAYVFEVELISGHKYTVCFSDEYYEKLTSGTVEPEELVRRSFEFLLEREGPEAILPEFELPTIQRYFADYEQTVKFK